MADLVGVRLDQSTGFSRKFSLKFGTQLDSNQFV